MLNINNQGNIVSPNGATLLYGSQIIDENNVSIADENMVLGPYEILIVDEDDDDIPQSDWNQNDETAADYIQNRPFYTDVPVETTIVEEQTVTIEEDGGFVQLDSNITLEIGQTYIVTFNGEKYECVVYELYGANVIGDGVIVNAEGGNKEPFLIVSEYNYVYAQIAGIHTFSINTIQEEIHHIDPKYIKDMYYEEDIYIPILNNATITIDDSQWDALPDQLRWNDKYSLLKITFDSVVYDCPLRSNSYFGNNSLREYVDVPVDTGEPFMLYQLEGGFMGIYTSPGTHSISIEFKTSNIHTISEKYLPPIPSSPADIGLDKALLLKDKYHRIPSEYGGYWTMFESAHDKIFASCNSGATYSVDGFNWNDIEEVTGNWNRVAYGNGVYVAIGGVNGNSAAYSIDGINWTNTTLPASGNWDCLAYGNNKFVAISGKGDVANSTDGVTWSYVTNSPGWSLWRGLIYADNKFVAISANEGIVTYSSDGITWTNVNIPYTGNYYHSDIAYGNGKFISPIEGNEVLYSLDGITWNKTDMPVSEDWETVTYGNDKFVMLAFNYNKAAYSTDGINWYESEAIDSNYFSWQDIIYANGKYFASGTTGYISWSDDGIHWESKILTLETPNQVNKTNEIKSMLEINSKQDKITGTPGQFVVIGDDGNVTTKTVPNAEEVAF